MVIVMKPGTPEQEWKKIKENLEGRGYQINEIVGSGQTILGVIGDTSALDMNMLKVNECVDKVMRVQDLLNVPTVASTRKTALLTLAA